MHATDEVIAVADKLGAGCAKALLGKAALPDDLPWVTGSIGLLGTKPSYDLMTKCDTLLMIGSGFPYAEFLPKEGQAQRRPDRPQAGHAEPALSDGGQPRRRQRRDAARAAAAAASRSRTAPGARRLPGWTQAWWKTLEERAMAEANPINPQRVAWELSPRLPDNAIITSDSGSCANWYARDLKIRRGMMCSLSGGLASMGAAVPYAIAAKFAHPDRPVIALVGDGAMQMNNMAELITVAKYWRDWASPHWIVRGLEQRGPQPGDLGAAGHGGRSEVRGVAEHPERALSQVRRADRAEGHLCRPRRGGRRRPGRRRCAPTARWCSRSRPIRRCRRCRRTSRSTQAKHFASALIKVDPARNQHHRGHRPAGAGRFPAGQEGLTLGRWRAATVKSGTSSGKNGPRQER